jgi:hypothetical protein
MVAECRADAKPRLESCTDIAGRNKNTNSAWRLRASYDHIASECPDHAHDDIVGRLEQCVLKVEANELADDPQAPQRRAEAKSRVAATKHEPHFMKLWQDWSRALDGKNISCRNRDASDSDAHECDRWHDEMHKAEDQLRAYLVAAGYDARDVDVLGLWPHDAAYLTNSN